MTQHPHPNLGTPSKLADGGLRIVALGGISEIGRNMTVYETNGKLLIIDCGVLFPEDNQPGIYLILPDFSYIRDRLNDVVGLFLTHGHEDHIGAVPYLLRERGDIPVYGSALTIALIAAKCKEHRISPLTHEVREGNREDVGPFELEFIAVNHSIPDALAVAVHTKAGTVLHTGDFKMDQLPLDGRITDLRTFARLGEEGVDLFLVDSTNADVPGFTPSEREIMPALNRVIASTKRRVIVASFSSHVHRVQQVIDTAAIHNRKVAFIGRSMIRNMKIAQDMGYLSFHREFSLMLANSITMTIALCLSVLVHKVNRWLRSHAWPMVIIRFVWAMATQSSWLPPLFQEMKTRSLESLMNSRDLVPRWCIKPMRWCMFQATQQPVNFSTATTS